MLLNRVVILVSLCGALCAASAPVISSTLTLKALRWKTPLPNDNFLECNGNDQLVLPMASTKTTVVADVKTGGGPDFAPVSWSLEGRSPHLGLGPQWRTALPWDGAWEQAAQVLCNEETFQMTTCGSVTYGLFFDEEGGCSIGLAVRTATGDLLHSVPELNSTIDCNGEGPRTVCVPGTHGQVLLVGTPYANQTNLQLAGLCDQPEWRRSWDSFGCGEDDAGLVAVGLDGQYAAVACDAKRVITDVSVADGQTRWKRAAVNETLLTPNAQDMQQQSGIFTMTGCTLAALNESTGLTIWEHDGKSEDGCAFDDGLVIVGEPPVVLGWQQHRSTVIFTALDATEGTKLWEDTVQVPAGRLEFVSTDLSVALLSAVYAQQQTHLVFLVGVDLQGRSTPSVVVQQVNNTGPLLGGGAGSVLQQTENHGAISYKFERVSL